MNLDHQFESTPVIYGSSPVKLLGNKQSQPVFRPVGEGMHPHWHDRIEIHLLDAGSYHYYIAGEQYLAKEGDVVIINPCAVHSSETLTEYTKTRVVMFELKDYYGKNDTFKKLLEPFVLRNSAFYCIVSDKAVYDALDQMYDINANRLPGFELALVSQVYRLLSLLLAQYINKDYNAPDYSGRFKDVIDYISSHFTENISSRTISEKFGYDEAYFSRRFKAVTGLRPMEYIKILRLEKARTLLSDPGKNISGVALSCGFSDSNYFLRCFKKHYHYTVSDYRQKIRLQ